MTRVSAGRPRKNTTPPTDEACRDQATTAESLSYVLRSCNDAGGVDELRLTVWEMSILRDEMLVSGAAHGTLPAIPPPPLAARCPSGLEGVPAYKLAGPDGWLVRSDEIREALRVLRARVGPQGPLWLRWIQFLGRAEQRGGFTVR